MSAAFVTVCPACATRFRVTDAQLQAAGGRVRCGACLDVFDALLHVEDSNAGASVGGVEGRGAAGADTVVTALAVPTASAASNDPSSDSPSDSPKKAFNSVEADEVALARDLLRSSSGELAAPAARGLRFTLVDDNHSYNHRNHIDFASVNSRGGVADQSAGNSANASPGAFVSPSRDAPQSSVLPASGPHSSARHSSALHSSAVHSSAPQGRRRSVLDHVGDPVALSDEERRRLSALGVEPDLGDAAPRPGSLNSRLVYPAVAAVVLLLAQYVYFRADALASSLTVRPWYERVCHVFGCTVPVFKDPTMMHSRNMFMRAVPRRPDVLLINAQVLNDAPYPQPFPDVLVEILDRQGGTLSSRVFTPMDYRRGELATIPLVPPHRPLQLSLEVFNPGTTAVNFRFELQPVGR